MKYNLQDKIYVVSYDDNDCGKLSLNNIIDDAMEDIGSKLKTLINKKPYKCSFKIIYTGIEKDNSYIEQDESRVTG